MKPTDIELRRIAIPLVAPFRTSFGTQHTRELGLVRVRTEQTDGWGELVTMISRSRKQVIRSGGCAAPCLRP
ncbi:hypothetical protein KGQ20_29625 [Catenulispora sp. NF23]|uniref:O-succinylbenzoate synthase n=1 Tax=Catenulispora pinistramenti TaxID=2705254 RepID=A0ABS5L3X9_9ACTN|nr:hypothetical protein [Catenulispora pinistramenti]MBS2536931.1 hypothetical protein [Catenulispora pinistramenti]MBS2553046.1 hypothetical protein [Catenulispora pinistramenti]